MIEPLACRTPVIARPCGSVPEILRSGVASRNWLNMRQIAARPPRNLAGAALARYATRQWHPALYRDRLNTRWKECGSLRQIISNPHDTDAIDGKKFDT